MRTIRGRFAAVFGFFFFALCASASAQLFPGRVTGTVLDSQAAAVPGATLKLTNVSTGRERSTVSGANGDFNFPGLPLGTFQLVASKAGFQTTVVRDIITSQGQVNNVKPVLSVGSVSSQVEVTSAPPLIQTETNSSGGQLSQQQVQALPIGNSDYTRLALVLPEYLASKDVQIQRAAGIRIPYQLLQCIQSPELCRGGAGFDHDH